jgi:hypothetical protein
MISYTQQRDFYGKFTQDLSAENLDDGTLFMNEYLISLLAKTQWPFMETLDESLRTVADQQFYELPADYRRLIGKPYIVSGTTKYFAKRAPTREFWDKINQVSTTRSDFPQYYYIQGTTIGFYPIPATTDLVIGIPYERKQKALNIADHTTGTIVSIANGAKAVVGSGTSWNASMRGRWIRITASNAANVGDHEWYEIASVTDATNLTLVKPYQGASIAAGSSAYVMGQMSLLPEGFDRIPIFRAAADYWMIKNETRADSFTERADRLEQALMSSYGAKTSNMGIPKDEADVLPDVWFPRGLSN